MPLVLLQYGPRNRNNRADCVGYDPRATYCIKDKYCEVSDPDVCIDQYTVTYRSSCGYIQPRLGGYMRDTRSCDLSVIISIDRRYRVSLEIEFSNFGPVTDERKCLNRTIVIFKTSMGKQLLVRLCGPNTAYNGTADSDWNTMLMKFTIPLPKDYLRISLVLFFAIYRSVELDYTVLRSA